jgi:hypothetical protein
MSGGYPTDYILITKAKVYVQKKAICFTTSWVWKWYFMHSFLRAVRDILDMIPMKKPPGTVEINWLHYKITVDGVLSSQGAFMKHQLCWIQF